MENVIMVVFQDEANTYQVLSDLKNRSGQSTVLEAGIIANAGGSIVVKDGWSNGGHSTAWASGGLIGTLIGILGGPLGMLLGAGIGMLIGSVMDSDDTASDAGVIEQAAHNLQDGYLALVLIADETSTDELDAFFKHYNANTIIRRDVASVQAEIYQAEETARELRKQAKKKMREEKKAEWKKKGDETQAKVKEEIAGIKGK